MTHRMSNLQLPSSQEDCQQVSQREVERYQLKERRPIDSKLGSEVAYRQTERIVYDQINSNSENSPDSSIEFLGYKRRAGCQIQKDIQNPLRKILHRSDRFTQPSMNVKPSGNDKQSDESLNLNQSFFSNLLDKNNTFYSKTNNEIQNGELIESKVRNIEDLFEDVFLLEIQKNSLCTLMQKGKKEKDRSYQQSESQQASMGIRLNNQNIQQNQVLGQKLSPNYPQVGNNQLQQYVSSSNNQPLRALRSTSKAIKKQGKAEKRFKNIEKANSTEEIEEIHSENEIQVTNLKSLEITTNMARKQNHQSLSIDKIAENDQSLKQNSKTKKIKPYQSSWILSNRDQQLFQEFLEVIRITNDRNMPNGEKGYRWKLGTLNVWRDINTALQINFSTFLRQSKKYKRIFKRYIPQQFHFKIQIDENRKKEETQNLQNIPEAKLQSRRERKKKQQINNLAKIRQLFNKAQLARIIDYERMIDQKGRSEVLSQLAQSQYSDYEPESAVLENMIEEIIVKTNKKQKKGSKIEVNEAQMGEISAKNELVLYNLTKASRDFNYIRNMANIFYFYRRVPTLSCLGEGSLGLRSNNCKIIDQSTFLLELKQIQIRDFNTTIAENNSLDMIKFERSSVLFTDN